jgi:hypothetical protein
MKLKIDGDDLLLGKLRQDGFRNVERFRLANYRSLLPAPSRAKLRSVMDDKRLLLDRTGRSQPTEARLHNGGRVRERPLLRWGAFRKITFLQH